MAQEQSFANLQEVALSKSADSILLLSHGRFSNAYYLAGYAVEIGLKACIALQFRAEHIPDRRLVNIIHTHQLHDLVFYAGLKDILTQRKEEEQEFWSNWAQVSSWTPESRYLTVDALTAQAMVHAVSNPQTGILEWIRAYW